jgi:hypothetical protein
MSDDLTNFVQIDDPQIDVAEIARRVAQNLRARGFDKDVAFPEFTIVPPRFEEGARFPAALYHELEQATLAYGRTWVAPQPVASRLPLLAWIKRAFHRLVVFYVNLLGERQMVVNAAFLRVLTQMVKTLDDEQSARQEVAALRREVAELRARLERLEQGKDRGE